MILINFIKSQENIKTLNNLIRHELILVLDHVVIKALSLLGEVLFLL
ncbi:hypothetical protein XBKB1_470008 [Xenorhabdus bovienii str. kraussei Becker Underwood]|uniref:Uncharacterized protein n=1 Tax=Xenorhabdus bovienii str. kraussei Becker Underwood TaxID=1398204 RepID=A0A077PZJ9_XENBV|nr:hypothetical protein XBKB1_470008 [Xenorhabdus bovienii str. kraussei Becker Underwood]